MNFDEDALSGLLQLGFLALIFVILPILRSRAEARRRNEELAERNRRAREGAARRPAEPSTPAPTPAPKPVATAAGPGDEELSPWERLLRGEDPREVLILSLIHI